MVSRTFAAQSGGRVTDLESRSPDPRRDGAVADRSTGSGAELAPVEPQRARRIRRSGTGYDLTLKHSDPTSLDPEYIVRSGEPVDAEPGRTSRLTWTKGRRRPISDREAYNVWWRRKAARLKRLYADPDKNLAVLAKMPPTLEEALATIPDELPPWDATRAVVKSQLPERLLAIANAYADMQGCSLPQLVELALYRMVTDKVTKPSDFEAEYYSMREQTYQIDREQRLNEREQRRLAADGADAAAMDDEERDEEREGEQE